MTIIVKKVTQLLSGAIFLFGIYIMVHGHLTPGGGFAGGTLIAGSFILLILSYGSEYLKLVHKEMGSALTESVAIFCFLLFAIAGILIGVKVFFYNFLPIGEIGKINSAGIIPFCNVLIGIEVAAALISIFYAFLIFKEEVTK